jgi:hypothetical protein
MLFVLLLLVALGDKVGWFVSWRDSTSRDRSRSERQSVGRTRSALKTKIPEELGQIIRRRNSSSITSTHALALKA